MQQLSRTSHDPGPTPSPPRRPPFTRAQRTERSRFFLESDACVWSGGLPPPSSFHGGNMAGPSPLPSVVPPCRHGRLHLGARLRRFSGGESDPAHSDSPPAQYRKRHTACCGQPFRISSRGLSHCDSDGAPLSLWRICRTSVRSHALISPGPVIASRVKDAESGPMSNALLRCQGMGCIP